MQRLVTIDLRNADITLFEEYEAIVLQLLPKYGAKLEHRLRTTDHSTETHVLSFPAAEKYEAYLADNDRHKARHIWESCGASASSVEVYSL